MLLPENIFEMKLKQHGLSLTKQRRALYDVLTQDDTFTMAQLVTRLHKVMDRTSVYRSVALFEKVGIINRIQIGWKYKLELSDEYSSHHHHAACMQCGAVVVFEEDDRFESDIKKLALSLGFTLSAHTLELRGLCKSCSEIIPK